MFFQITARDEIRTKTLESEISFRQQISQINMCELSNIGDVITMFNGDATFFYNWLVSE